MSPLPAGAPKHPGRAGTPPGHLSPGSLSPLPHPALRLPGTTAPVGNAPSRPRPHRFTHRRLFLSTEGPPAPQPLRVRLLRPHFSPRSRPIGSSPPSSGRQALSPRLSTPRLLVICFPEVKFTRHKIRHFKEQHLGAFGACAGWCNHHPSLVPERSTTPKGDPGPSSGHSLLQTELCPPHSCVEAPTPKATITGNGPFWGELRLTEVFGAQM